MAARTRDKYSSFAELARFEEEGQTYRIRIRSVGSRTFIVAPHGGGIERGTSELTQAVAADDLSFYIFEGIKKSGNHDLHIMSTRFDEPQCLELIQQVERVVTIHGESRDKDVLFLGGLDAAGLQQMQSCLEKNGFAVMKPDKVYLKGTAVSNVCNRSGSGAGVQIEIAEGMRRTFFKSLTADGARVTTARFRQFVSAVREGIQVAEAAATGGLR
jgi:phage replication-related protein YjqB (UPF0714/DUF867 family)